MKGVPFIYNGQEVGTSVPMTFPFTSTTIDWTINPSVTALYKKVIAFRNSNAAIRRGSMTSYCSYDVFVIDNLRNTTINYTIPAVLSNSTWSDVFTGKSVTLSTQVTLQPYIFMVLENK
jgi:hypothetical protein